MVKVEHCRACQEDDRGKKDGEEMKMEKTLSCKQKKTYKQKYSKNEAEGNILMTLLDAV